MSSSSVSSSDFSFTQTHIPTLVRSHSLPHPDVFELYSRVASADQPSFLLESGNGTEGTGQYSFFGSNPYLTFWGKNTHYMLQTSNGVVQKEGEPFTALLAMLTGSPFPRIPYVPPFVGGAVGFFSYDMVHRLESLPRLAADDLHCPDLGFLFVDLVAAVDHQTQTLHLMFSPPPERLFSESHEKLFEEGKERLREWEARLLTPCQNQRRRWSDLSSLDLHADQSRSAFMNRIETCQSYISAGDIYQANLSHRFTVSLQQDGSRTLRERSLSLYDRLRRVNPSPFSGLLVFDNLAVVSSSPERLVCLKGRNAQSRPIAGTRARGLTRAEDHLLTQDLLHSTKERAEHLMLLDLARNDLGRVCQYGSVRVDEFMTVEQYSHVTHLVSNVTGILQKDQGPSDLIRAVFPGGTITGAPKIRCMEIIEELEPVRRGLYTGSLGYISWTGDLDLNIMIRTLLLKHGYGYLQVGAGIVADSDPQREYDETLFKAQAFFEALRLE